MSTIKKAQALYCFAGLLKLCKKLLVFYGFRKIGYRHWDIGIFERGLDLADAP